jgi:hypothetical protein
MADFYSILPGLQVNANDVTAAELMAQQILQAQFPDLDLREGTAERDLLIRPAASLLAIVKKGLDLYFAQNTLAQIDDTTPTTILDDIMSNWFISRLSGSLSVINVRLYFARQKNISITTDIFFSPDNTLRYFPQTSFVIPSASLSYDSYSNEFYYDLDLVAEIAGTQYNLSGGSLLYFSTFDPYFLHAEINYLKQTAVNPETNTQFINRAQNAISTRNLINNPSITSNLQSNFNTLAQIQTIGGGDPEMIRDVAGVTVPDLTSPLLVHLGGMTDVYCKAGLISSIVQLPSDANGRVTLTGPIYKLSRSSISGGAAADTIPLTLSKTITSLTSSGNVATATLTAHGYNVGESVTIAGATPTGYNGTFSIATVPDLNTFTYAIIGPLASPATGTITSAINTPYTLTYNSLTAQTLTSLTSSSGVATATLPNHSFFTGRWITISGATPSGYNGTVRITGTTKDTFTYVVPSGLASPATGTIAVTGTAPYKDTGFSGRQVIYADFGPSLANGTASFEISYFQYLDDVQAYLDDANNRVTAGDYLARGFNIYLLDIAIVGYAGSTPDSGICTTVATNYLGSLFPGQPFIINDLQAALFDGGVKSLKTPVGVNYTYYTRDQLSATTGTITDFLDPQDRTAVFVLNSLTTSSQSI